MPGADEGTGTIPGVLDVPIYESKSEKEFWSDSDNKDEDDKNDSDDISDEGDDDNDGNNGNDSDDDDKQEGDDTNDDDEETDSDRTESDRIKIPILDQSTTEYYEEEEKIYDEEMMDDDENDEVTKELYQDVNVNLGNEDTDMTNANQGASEQQNVDELVQGSFVSSDFTSKLLNLENLSPADNKIASLMETSARHAMTVPEITSGFTTTIPPPPSFKDRVSNLEKYLSEIKQVDQYAQALSSIRAIILPQAVSDFLNPVIEKNVTESVEAAVLRMSSSQPKSTYKAAASLSEFELTKILIDKMEKNKSYDKADYKKKFYDALVESYNIDKDLFDSYGEVFSLKRSRKDRDKDQDPFAELERGTKRRKSNKDAEQHVDSQPSQTWISQVTCAKEPRTSFDELMDTSFDFSASFLNRLNIKDLTQEILVGLTFELLKGTCKSLTELEYHLEECSKATTEQLDWHNPEGKPYPFDLSKYLALIRDHQGRQIIPRDFFINNDLEYLKGGDLSRRSNLRNITTYTAYSDPKGVIYKDQMNRNRLMHVDELHKFSNGTLDDVWSALNDIAKGIKMEYLPKRKGNGLDKRRARVMIQDIDKQLYVRMLMRNLEKFVGGREYGKDLGLLKRTI
ncbi:hypothetical protein Tco_0345773 [Tanacetum coccineum]